MSRLPSSPRLHLQFSPFIPYIARSVDKANSHSRPRFHKRASTSFKSYTSTYPNTETSVSTPEHKSIIHNTHGKAIKPFITSQLTIGRPKPPTSSWFRTQHWYHQKQNPSSTSYEAATTATAQLHLQPPPPPPRPLEDQSTVKHSINISDSRPIGGKRHPPFIPSKHRVPRRAFSKNGISLSQIVVGLRWLYLL